MKSKSYIYVVHIPADDPNEFGWFSVFPTKAAAMDEAKAQAAPINDEPHKSVTYLPCDGIMKLDNFLASQFVVVCQETSLYFGA